MLDYIGIVRRDPYVALCIVGATIKPLIDTVAEMYRIKNFSKGLIYIIHIHFSVDIRAFSKEYLFRSIHFKLIKP